MTSLTTRMTKHGRSLGILIGAVVAATTAGCSQSEQAAAEKVEAESGEEEVSELELGMRRMENEKVLTVSEEPLPPREGVRDSWEYELAPFESIEFKYTIAEDQPMHFTWEGSGELHYDMHSHPFDGGTDLTESYGIGDARVMHGSYIPAFTGVHGWFWENRTMEPVTVRVEASGSMTKSTIYSSAGSEDRPIEGANTGVTGEVAGHELQE